jgi:hypothetical protein
MSMSTRIEIETAGLGERGQRYRVLYAGKVLIETTRVPEFDACRALVELGISGRLEVWHKGASFAAMRLDIDSCAGWTAEESDRIGPRLARWEPRPERAAA